MRLATRLAPILLLCASAAAGAEDNALQCTKSSVVAVLDTNDGMAEGACVSISAFVVDGLLMDDVLHRYAAERRYNDPSSSGVQLGLSGWADDDGARGAAQVRATGVLRRCGEGPFGDLLPKTDDFCGQRRGIYLDAVQVEVTSRAPMRRGLRRDGVMLGNMLRLADGPQRQAVTAEFRRALLTFRGKHGPSLPDDAVIDVFGWRTPTWADAEDRTALILQGEGQGMAEAVACAMPPQMAAQNLWPISTRDIGAAAGRPYICMRVTQHPDGRLTMDQNIDPDPAVEG